MTNLNEAPNILTSEDGSLIEALVLTNRKVLWKLCYLTEQFLHGTSSFRPQFEQIYFYKKALNEHNANARS